MPSFLRRIGAAGLTFSCLLSAQAATAASTMCVAGMLGCGIAFETPIEPTPSPLTTTTTGQTSYTIINNDNVNDVNITISLTELDSIGDAMAVQFDNSMTCPQSGTLAAGATCTIVLDFAPSFPGELDWALTVTPTSPYTAQLPQVLTLETAVTGTFVPYASTGGVYTNTDGSYPLLTLSTDGGSSWNYVLDEAATPYPYQYDPTNIFQTGITANSCTGSYCVGGGNYYDIHGNYYIFVASNVGSGSWSYTFDSSSAAVPSDYSTFNGGELYAGSCASATCMLAGFYYSTDTQQYPLAIMSVDGGANWNLSMSSTLNLPSDISTTSPQAPLNGVSCATPETCVVVGSYLNTSNGNYPLIAQGTSLAGVWTWTYPDISSQVPTDINDYHMNLQMSNLSCVGSACVVGGSYGAPLLYMSFNAGNDWSLLVDSSSSVVPSDWTGSSGGNIYGASCSDTACAVSGVYSSETDGYQYPYLATAVFSDTYPCTNAGNCNWTSVIDSSNLYGLDISQYGGELTDVSCSETTCVASGFYDSSTDGTRYPLVATFTLSDSSVTYTVDYSSMNPGNLPTDFYQSFYNAANLDHVNCSGLFCSAAGYYISASNNNNIYPFMVTSQDAGYSWTYTIDGTTSSLPSTTSFVTGYFDTNSVAPPTVKK